MRLDAATQALLGRSLQEAFQEELEGEEDVFRPKKLRKTHNHRKRRYVNSIFVELGNDLTRRAYRMHAASFWKLLGILDAGLSSHFKPRVGSGRGSVGGAKNGKISNATRLSVAIRYFAGGRPEDIALVHGISHTEVFKSVWRVVDAVNTSTAPEIACSFPKKHEDQQQLAVDFKAVSAAGFDNCCGAMDCMMIWTEQPTLASCKAAACGRLKFFCGRKHKYGIGLQAVCDAFGRFLNIFLGHPATTSDYLAWRTSPLYHLITKNKDFLAPGFHQ